MKFYRDEQIFLGVLIFYLVFITIIISKYDFNLTCLVGMSKEEAEKYPTLIPANMICFVDKGAYDGQDYYLLASSNFNLLSKENYRYDRILYALLIYLFSLGAKKSLIHYAMLFINLSSILIALYFMSKLLKIYNISGLVRLVFACNIGYMMVIQYLLSEALPIAFLVAGLYFHSRKRLISMCILFSLCWLSRSATALVTLLPFAFYLLLKKQYREFLLITISVLPYVFYQIFLILKFGHSTFISQFKTYGSLYAAYSLPFAGLIEWVKRIEIERKGMSLLWEFGVLPFIIFMLLCVIYATKELFKLKTFNIYKFVFLMTALYGLTRTYEQWSSIAGCSRQSLEMIVFLLLSYTPGEKNRFYKLLIYFSLFMSLLGIIRAITYPRFDYILS